MTRDQLARLMGGRVPGYGPAPSATTGSHVRRVMPQGVVVGGIDYGPTLGCLRYLSRRPPGVRVETPWAYWLALDPAQTAPNAIIGISFSGGRDVQEYLYIRPGDPAIHVPSGFNHFFAYNADNMDVWFDLVNQPANGGLGYCSFLVGTDPDAGPPEWLLTARPNGMASIIAAGFLQSPANFAKINVPATGFSAQGIREAKVTLIGTDGGGIPQTTVNYAVMCDVIFSTRQFSNVAGSIAPPLTETFDTYSAPLANAILLNQKSRWATTAKSGGGISPLRTDPLHFSVPAGAQWGQICVPLNTQYRFAVGGATTPTQVFAIVEGMYEPHRRGERLVKTIVDIISPVAGLADTLGIDTSSFDELICYAVASGAAAPAVQPAVAAQDENNNSIVSDTLTLGVAGAGKIVYGEGGGQDVAASKIFGGPVPQRIRFTATGGAASQVRLIVVGIEES